MGGAVERPELEVVVETARRLMQGHGVLEEWAMLRGSHEYGYWRVGSGD